MDSATPKVVKDIAREVPLLRIRTELSYRLYRNGGGPPRDFIHREHGGKLARELAPFLTHEWSWEYERDQEVCESSISKPLTPNELISILSRAYQAGRDSR